MLTAVFAITTVICAIGWLSRHIGILAMVYYIESRGYKQPTDAEIKECAVWAAKKVLGK